MPKGFNLHRNVMLRNGGLRAKQVVPPVTQPPFGYTNPDSLYDWLEMYQEKPVGVRLPFRITATRPTAGCSPLKNATTAAL